MSKDLYFIPIIEQALKGEDPGESLREAFRQIVRLGREPLYGDAFVQFRRFMEEVESAHVLLGGEEPSDQIMEVMTHPFPIGIIVEKEGQAFGTCRFDTIPGRQSISNVLPGGYRIKMETGRVIWEGPITEKECIWKKAYPGRPLKLAADTGEDDLLPSKTVPLLEGTILLQFYPGVGSGVLAIKLLEGSGG